jgi:hypothetical protein
MVMKFILILCSLLIAFFVSPSQAAFNGKVNPNQADAFARCLLFDVTQNQTFNALKPAEGGSVLVLPVSKIFTPDVVQQLWANLPRGVPSGSHDLIVNGRDVSAEYLNNYGRGNPGLAAALRVPMAYAHAKEIMINQLVSPLEIGRVVHEYFGIRISDGNQPQINENRHQDSLRYMSDVTNLGGVGPELLLPGSPTFGIDTDGAPIGNYTMLPPGFAVFFSGALRNQMLPGPGTVPAWHNAARGGQGRPRLGIVSFWTLVDRSGQPMPAFQLAQAISDLRRQGNAYSQQQIANMIQQLQAQYMNIP